MTSQSVDELKAQAREFFRQAYTLGNEAVIDELMAPDVLHHGLTREPMVGRDAFKQWYRAFRGSFSEILCSVTHVCVEDDLLAARVLFTGRHTGAYMGPPPTGNMVSLAALVLCRFENGLIAEGFNEFDHLALLQQLGVTPGSAPNACI
jgi:predicted ester cyclase